MADTDFVSTREQMMRVVACTTGAASALFLVTTIPSIVAQFPIGAWWFETLALVLMAVPAIVLSAGAFRLPMRSLRFAAGLLAVGQLAIVPPMVSGFPNGAHVPQGVWPWFLANTAPCIMAAALAWNPRALLYYVPSFAVLFCFGMWWAFEGAGVFFIERTVAGVVAFSFMVAMVGVGAWSGGAVLDDETRRLRAEAAARAEVEASVLERARLDGVVHDNVLAALQAGVAGTDDRQVVRNAAAQALDALHMVSTPPELQGSISGAEVVARLRQQCTDLDEFVAVRVKPISPETEVDSAAVHVLHEVVAEALRNSLQHAGSEGRSVRRVVTIDIGSSVQVSVQDNGIGFDTRHISPGRLGISVIMRERIASVPGATLQITSAPGAGTTITATLPSHPSGVIPLAVDPVDGDAGSVRSAPDVLGLHSWGAAAVATAYLIAVAARPFQIVDTGIVNGWYLLAAAFMTAAAGLLLTRSSDPMPHVLAWAVAGCTIAAAVCNIEAVRHIAVANQGLMWVWGPGTVVVGFLTVRGRFAAAWTAEIAMIIGYCLGYGHLGVPFGGIFVSQFVWNILLFIVFALFAKNLRRIVQEVTATRARSVALAAERGRSQAQLRERDALLRYLNTAAVPLLEHLAGSSSMDSATRCKAHLLEGRLRDRIRARAIATEPVLDAAESARARGVDVFLLDDGALEGAADTLRSEVYTAVVDHLNAARGGRVTARVMPPGREAVCTIVRSDGDQDFFIEVPVPVSVG